MRAAIGSQCKLINRGVTCILFGSLKINLAAAFWINCKGLMLEDEPREHCPGPCTDILRGSGTNQKKGALSGWVLVNTNYPVVTNIQLKEKTALSNFDGARE